MATRNKGAVAKAKRLKYLALWNLVNHVAHGACGYSLDEDSFFTAPELSRFIPALQALFPDSPRYLWLPQNLENFNNRDTATDFLSKAGVEP